MFVIKYKFGFAVLLSFCSLFAFGKSSPFQHLTITNDTVEIDYEFMDKASFLKEAEFTEIITQSFEAYEGIFGGLPRNKNGEKYNNFTVRIKQGRNLNGEADPQIIILTWSESTMFGYANWKTLLLHELFHLWSAESIRYADPKEQWFNEGFAEYFSYRVAARLGLISNEAAISIATHPIGYYYSAKGLGKISMREAGKNNKSKFDNYFLIYNGGWVAAMTLDHDVRRRTKGAKSLDHLMKWLYINFPREKKLYDVEDIKTGLYKVSGFDYENYFDKYITGTQPIPVGRFFDLGKTAWDLKFNQAARSKHRFLLESLGID